MFGIIGAILIALWFFRSAAKVGKDSFRWMVAGIVFYYGTRVLWTYGVIKPLMGRSFYGHSATTGFMIEFSAIVLGVIAAGLVRAKVLMK